MKKQDAKPEPKPPKAEGLPEAFVKARSPERPCGELCFPVWEVFGGPKNEPPRE